MCESSEKSSNVAAFVALALSAVLWGSAFIASKHALTVFDPVVMVFLRVCIASLLVVVPFWKHFTRVSYQRGDWKYLLILVICEPCLYFLFEAHGLRFTTASQASIIMATMPFFAAVGVVVFLKEQITLRTGLGFFLAVGGAVWMSAGAVSTEAAPDPVLGNLLQGGAVLCATGYVLTAKYLTRRYSPHFLTALQALAGMLFFFPLLFMPFVELPDFAAMQEELPVSALLSVLYLGTFITLGAYGCYNYAMVKLSAAYVSLFTNFIPVCTVALGWLLLGETLTLQQCLAAGLVLVGIYMGQREKHS